MKIKKYTEFVNENRKLNENRKVSKLAKYFIDRKDAILHNQLTDASIYLTVGGNKIWTKDKDEANNIHRKEKKSFISKVAKKSYGENGKISFDWGYRVIYGGTYIRISDHKPVYMRSMKADIFYILDGSESSIKEMLGKKQTRKELFRK